MNSIKKALVGATAALALGLGTAGVAASGASAAPARIITHDCVATTTYGNGPGSGPFAKNYRAFDKWCDENYNPGGTWSGPWRLKKATADHDRDVRNAGRA